MSKLDTEKYCPDCGARIYKSSKRCRSCHNRTRHNKDGQDLLTTRRSLKIGIRGLPEYQQWKEIVMGRDKYKCRGCGATEKLDIHHLYKEYDIIFEEFCEKYKTLLSDKRTILQLALGWKEFWEVANGVTVCRKCHLACHDGTLKLENVREK